jgi:hypothetical protein
MFKALDPTTGQEIIILSPEWSGRITELRQMAAHGRLVCPGCRQKVRVRAGRWRRRHFAHQHLGGCAWGKESWEVLEARAVLFTWLTHQFSGDENNPQPVEIEKYLAESGLPRPVDCWVERPGEPALAYWIIDARMRLEARQTIKKALERAGIRVNWTLAARLLDPHGEEPADGCETPRLRLSPTERDFLAQSDYDYIDAELLPYPSQIGQTLHYLDASTQTLITYRSLVKVHAPNIFAGRCETHPLSEVHANPLTGEFIHPGEADRLAHSQQALAVQEEKQRQAVERLENFLSRRARGSSASKDAPSGNLKPGRDQAWGVAPASAGGREYPCVFCGALTSDWWTSFMLEGKRVCKCKECLKQGQR